jgi:soluble lytic murein transglycosylase-like protein
MLKRIIVLFLIVTCSVAVDDRFFDKSHIPIEPVTNKQIAGTVVAFYENEYQRYAIDLLTQRGKLEQWYCLYTLWTRESNWNPRSLNRKSGAYGIAQFMPETWALVNAKRTSNGFRQVEAGLAYIQRKYGGNICKALGSNLARGWY